jgi:hypothetical protein
MTAILAQPHALTNHQLQATFVYAAAIRCDWVRGWFDEVWFTAKTDTARAQPARDNIGRVDPADVLRCELVALRAALEVEEIYGALLSLRPEQRHGLFNSIRGHDRGNLVSAALATIPAGAEWLAHKAQRDAATNAANAARKPRRNISGVGATQSTWGCAPMAIRPSAQSTMPFGVH